MDVRELKVGDIVVCGEAPYRQLFYIHKRGDNAYQIVSSGVQERTQYGYFHKRNGWNFERKATEEEVSLFYQIIRDYGYKFDVNNGVDGFLI